MNTGNNLFDETAIDYDQWIDELENAFQKGLLPQEV